jgi:RNA polymerase sigma factor (sigma-70 family)
MATTAPPTTTADVAALHNRLTRFVYAHFHRKLTFEEAGDAAAEALGEADRAAASGKQIENLHAWLGTAAWRNAISMIRRIEGEGRLKRLRPLDITEQREWREDPRDAEAEILTTAGRRTENEALARAWKRLKPDEQRAIYLRYFDELPVDEVLKLLGCSRHHYENLTKRALRRMREALVDGAEDRTCEDCRAAILESIHAPLPPVQAARRDAHLSSCLMCKAFQRRQRGLMVTLPVPAIGLADRLAARFHGLRGSGASQHAEAATGSLAAAATGTTATAGAVGGGSVLTLGATGNAAAVLCSAAAVTAGVCATVLPVGDPPQKKDRAARVVQQASAPKQPQTAQAQRPVVQVAPLTTSAPTAGGSETSPAATQQRAAAVARRERAQRAERARRAASPFLPESAAPPPRPTAATASGARPITYSSASSPRNSSPSASPSPGRTAFSEEFTP